MYKKNGIKFRVSQRVEESLSYHEPTIYEDLQKCKIRDEDIWLGYDDVIKTFNPDWPYGHKLEDFKIWR